MHTIVVVEQTVSIVSLDKYYEAFSATATNHDWTLYIPSPTVYCRTQRYQQSDSFRMGGYSERFNLIRDAVNR